MSETPLKVYPQVLKHLVLTREEREREAKLIQETVYNFKG
jgi:hypothetical protein